jgi:hypothetical protein
MLSGACGDLYMIALVLGPSGELFECLIHVVQWNA